MNILGKAVITDICGIFTVMSPRGKSEKINNRKCWGISFCIDGKITYTHRGINVISDKDHAVILPEGQDYSIHGDKTGSFPVINFKCSETLCDTVISLPIEHAKSFIRDFERMKALSLFEENRQKVMSIFYDMLFRISSQDISGGIISPAIEMIENRYADPSLTNAVLAAKCNISEVYFRKVFAEKYKTTPKKYISEIRISKAKGLLAEGCMKIASVAKCCGFSNQYHFCRVFKQKTGLTPTEYTEKYKIYKI